MNCRQRVEQQCDGKTKQQEEYQTTKDESCQIEEAVAEQANVHHSGAATFTPHHRHIFRHRGSQFRQTKLAIKEAIKRQNWAGASLAEI